MAKGKENEDNALLILEKIQKKGKIKIGANETTKAVERGTAKIVFVAEDVQPKEIVMHLAPLCKKKETPCITISSRKILGEKAGMEVGAAAVVVVDEGDAKKEIEELAKKMKSE